MLGIDQASRTEVHNTNFAFIASILLLIITESKSVKKAEKRNVGNGA